MQEFIALQYYNSPCGTLRLASHNGKLCLCDWNDNPHRRLTDCKIKRFLQSEYIEHKSDIITIAITQLNEYFNCQRTQFDLPLLLIGSEFQKSIWHFLPNIPYGTTSSYSDITHAINRQTATRAVANAIGANPISIILPCHRVIGKNHNLTGYAGGLNAKQFLLNLEHSIT